MKVKVKYFYPQISNQNMINIQNDNNALNIEYNEHKMLNAYQKNSKKMNKNWSKRLHDSHDKAFSKTNCTSNHTEFNKNKIDSRLKDRMKTQNQKELSMLLSSWSSSASRKNKNKQQILSKSTNPFSSHDKMQWITESIPWQVKKAPQVSGTDGWNKSESKATSKDARK